MKLRDRIQDPNIIRVYWATLASGIAFGMALSPLAVYLRARGLEKESIGTLATWFASGIVLLSLPMSALIQRFSAKTTLAAAFIGYGITASAFPFLESYGAIAAVRMLDGACSVAIWVSSETILLSRAGPKNKAFVTSLYAITMASGYVIGPLISRAVVAVAPFSAAFISAGVVSLLTGLWVAWKIDGHLPAHSEQPSSAADSPEEIERKRVLATPAGSRKAILWRIKNSCFATFAFGYFQASVVLFMPIFMVEQKGVPSEQTLLVPAFFGGGMLLFSNIGGRLGDRLGHLWMMRILAAIGLATTMGFVFLNTFPLMATAIFIAGATIATISPLSLALQGVVIHPTEYHQSNSLYNVFYAAGMLLGPQISSTLFARFGGAAMLYHLAALWLAFVLFSILFRSDDPAAVRGRAAGFNALNVDRAEPS